MLWNKLKNTAKGSDRQKVFCIGFNKTGTTSIETIFRQLGYRLPDQGQQESLTVEALHRGDFAPLKKLCEEYDAFQDMPFSQGVTYAQVDCLFPNSKFILTVRDAEQWFESLVRFHLKGILKAAGVSDLSEVGEATFKDKAIYLHENYLYNISRRRVATVVENKLQYDWSLFYDKAHYIDIYTARNCEIIQYFQDRSEQLLVIDVTTEKDTQRLVDFLGLPSTLAATVPHLNKSN